MKPSTCKSKQYPCIFRTCKEKVCFTCHPDEDLPYICIKHRIDVLEYLAKNNAKKEQLRKGKLYNFKQWRLFQRMFPVYRWSIFLLMYKKVLKKYSNILLPNISKRYRHYFNAYVNVPESLTKSYQEFVLEEEIISDDDDFTNDRIVARGWNPIHSIYTIPHKDRDY